MLSPLVQNARRITKWFQQNEVAFNKVTDWIKQKNERLLEGEEKIFFQSFISETKTRWSSSFSSWCRVIRNYEGMTNAMRALHIAMPVELTGAEIDESTHICIVLGCIKEGTKLVEGSDVKGICSIYLPAVDHIQGELTTKDLLVYPIELDPPDVKEGESEEEFF